MERLALLRELLLYLKDRVHRIYQGRLPVIQIAQLQHLHSPSVVDRPFRRSRREVGARRLRETVTKGRPLLRDVLHRVFPASDLGKEEEALPADLGGRRREERKKGEALATIAGRRRGSDMRG